MTSGNFGGDQAAAGTATLELLTRARSGDRTALEELFARFGPELRRFAHGRLPQWARGMAETPDVVQETLLETFNHLEQFEHRGEGALRAYMRQAVMNRIRDELRRANRRPPGEPLDLNTTDAGPSPLEMAIGQQAVDRFETALATLPPYQRELVIARVELGLTYPEISAAMGAPSPNAARMAVVRALLRLAELLTDGRPDRSPS